MTEKRPLTFSLFILRLLSGITGGIAGTLAFFVIFFVQSLIVPEGQGTSLGVFMIIIMAFIGTLTANTVTALMVTFLDSLKYSRRKTTITHIFLFNLILFFLTIPLYLLGLSLGIVQGIAATHFLLSAFISALIMEIIAGAEYSLVGLYSASLGIFISIAVALSLLAIDLPAQTLLFIAMPGVWFVLQVSSGFTELLYDNYLRFYGVDALNVQTDLGGDTEIETLNDEEEDDTSEEPPTRM